MNTRCFKAQRWSGGFWFRIFGHGLHVRRLGGEYGRQLLFSERSGHKSFVVVNGWCVKWL